MSRQDANAAFALTSFLYGGNAAYIEDLYARYETDPASVDVQWQSFFQSLKDDPSSVQKSAKGASWKKPGWPQVGNGELVAALDGNWAETEKVLGDKIKGKAQKAGVELTSGDVLQATRD
ncbi:MAG: 2-oxoglutarate dehydrogenase E1 component, partial [Pseudorhodoplanes sp.]